MNRKLTIAVALVAGVSGGLIARYLSPPAVFAQNKAAVAKAVRAESFTLVDSADRTLGTFTAEPLSWAGIGTVDSGAVRIVLRDARGREIWSAGGNGIRPDSER